MGVSLPLVCVLFDVVHCVRVVLGHHVLFSASTPQVGDWMKTFIPILRPQISDIVQDACRTFVCPGKIQLALKGRIVELPMCELGVSFLM